MGWYEEQLAREAAEKAEREAKARKGGTTPAPEPGATQPGPFGTRLPVPPPPSPDQLGPRVNPPAGSYYDQILKEEVAAKAPPAPPDDGIIRRTRDETQQLVGPAMAGPDIERSDRTLKPTWQMRWDDWLARQAKKVTGAIEGRPEFDYPEIGTAGSQLPYTTFEGGKEKVGALDPRYGAKGLRMFGAALVSQTPEIRAEIISKTLPGAKILYGEGDPKKEFPIIEWQGDRFYVNKSGLSGSDLEKFAGDVIVTGILSRAGVAAKIPGLEPGAGRLKSGAGQAGLGGVSSLLQDAGAWALGSDKAIDPQGMAERAGVSTVLSGALGALFGKAGASAAKSGEKPPVRPEITSGRGRDVLGLPPAGGAATVGTESMPSQALLEKGRRVIREAGRDPDAFKPTQIAYIGNMLSRDIPPTYQEINAVLSNMSGVPIPLTRGQTTLDRPTIGREHALEKSTAGPSSTIMSEFRDQQDAKILGLKESMVRDPYRSDEAFGADVQGQVRTASDLMNQRVKEAYEKVGPSPAQAADMQAGRTTPLSPSELRERSVVFKPHASVNVVGAVEDHLRANDVTITSEITPAAKTMLGIIDKATRGEKIAGTDRVVPRVFNVEDMETTRRAINEQVKGAKNPTDFRATMKIKEAYDKWVDEAIDRGLYYGDASVIGKLKEARALRAEYGRKFEPDKIDGTVGDTIQKMINQDLNGEQVANFILGASRVTGDRNTRQLVDRFAKIGGGDDSPLMESVRDATRRRILFGTDPERKTVINPAQTARDIRSAFKGDGSAVTQRLLPGEKQEWLALADRLDQVAKRERGSVATVSSSESGIERAMADSFLLRMATAPFRYAAGAVSKTPIVGDVVEGMAMAGRKNEARRATASTPVRKLLGEGWTPDRNAGNVGLPAVAGQTAGREVPTDQIPSLFDQMFGGP